MLEIQETESLRVLVPLGNGCLTAKTDLDFAFKLIPVHFQEHNLFGFQFNGQFYYDCALPWAQTPRARIFQGSPTIYNG